MAVMCMSLSCLCAAFIHVHSHDVYILLACITSCMATVHKMKQLLEQSLTDCRSGKFDDDKIHFFTLDNVVQ